MINPFFDPLQILFILPALLLGIIASLLVKYWNNKYSKIINISRLSGVEIVNKLAPQYKLDLRLEIIGGFLSDNYDPRSRTLNLSDDVARGTSIASVAIAAHEVAHAIQHQEGSILFSLRSILIPTLSFGTNLGYILLIIGIIINFTGLAWIGVFLFSGAAVFSLLTLPVEIDASNRALKMLRSEKFLFPDELLGAKKVLSAAALTYVAASLQALGQLLYFIFRVQRIGKRD